MMYNLIMLITFFTPIVIIISGMRRGEFPDSLYKRAVISTLIAITVVLIGDTVMGGLLQQEINTSIELLKEVFEQVNLESAGINAEDFGATLDALGNSFILSIPSYTIIWSLIIAFVAYKICYKIFTRKGNNKNLINMTYFKDITLKREFFSGVLIIFVLSIIASFVLGSTGQIIYGNVSTVVEFLFIVQGMAVIVYFLTAKRVPNALAVAIAVFIYFLPFASLVLMILGVVEAIFGVRRRIGLSR